MDWRGKSGIPGRNDSSFGTETLEKESTGSVKMPSENASDSARNELDLEIEGGETGINSDSQILVSAGCWVVRLTSNTK